MRLSVTAAALSTLFLTSACETKRSVSFLPTPPTRLICEQAGSRPALPPEHRIDWSKVRTVSEAKIQHDQFVKVLRTREGIVAGYVLKLEGVNFACWNNMQWRREYEADLAKKHPPQ